MNKDGKFRTELWYMKAPATGATTITVTISADAELAAGSVSYAGVAQGTDTFGQVATDANPTAVSQLKVNVAVPENWVLVGNLSAGPQGRTFAPMTAVQEIWAQASTSPTIADPNNWVTSLGGQMGAGGSTFGWTVTGATLTPYAIVAVPLKPEINTAVKMVSFTATQQDGGVLLKWRTGREVSNLGFNVYRDGVKVTPSPVAGSALLAGAKTVLPAGNSYSWFDPDGSAANSYTLEDLDIGGAKTVHGPVRAEGIAASFAAEGRETSRGRATALASRRTSLLLNQLGRGASSNTVSLSRAGKISRGKGHSDSTAQAALASGAAVKIGVRSEGWYRVDANQLVSSGMPANVDPSRLQLFAEGQEQAFVVRGSGKVQAIEFYGTGIDTTFSDTRVYWLTWDGRSGARAQSGDAKGSGGAPVSYPASLEWRPRSVYFAALINGDADNFFGPVLASTDPVTQSLPAAHLSAGGGVATLQVRMQGVSAGAHSVVVQVNGTDAGLLSFSGQANMSSIFTLSAGVLHEGSNTLKLATYGKDDITAVDSVILTYPHTYAAENDYLRFTAPAGAPVTVGGFTSDQIQVVDVTDPANPVLVDGSVASQSGSYGVSFATVGGGERTLLAFTTARQSQPASIAANRPSSWRAPQAGADMVIISHGAFSQNLTPLVVLRQKQGHQVAVVDVEDVFDEFNFGEQTPYAIKEFLANANSVWSTKPRWVLLVGDATSDPRDYLQSGQVDYLPVELVGTSQLETSSDDWFVDFNDDGLPEMAIGRLPATSPASASAMVGKIVAFEQVGNTEWKKKALLISGSNDSDNDFESYASQVQSILPLASTKVLVGSDPSATAHIVQAINAGVGLVDYIGHGSTDIWEDVFEASDVNSLTDRPFTPFVISMTCLNGYFQDVYTTSLAESLMTPAKGGAVGVWASSSLTSSRSQASLNQAMVSALYGGAGMTVGEAAMAAKRAVDDSDVRRTWMLFGDPAMNVR